MLRKLDLPPIWTLLCIFSSWLLARLFPDPNFHNVFTALFGVGLMGYGLLMAFWSVVVLWRSKTPIEPHKKPKELVTIGPYHYSRNPIYTAMVVFSAGVAFILGVAVAFLPVIVLFFILRTRFVVPEEARLRESFGQDAESYIQNTRRW